MLSHTSAAAEMVVTRTCLHGQALERTVAHPLARCRAFHLPSGLKAAIALAVVGAEVAEFVPSAIGLGYLIETPTSFGEVQVAGGAMIVLSILGITLFQVIVAIERTLLPSSPGIDKPTR